MKVPFVLPLPDDAVAVLQSLPRFTGPYVFSVTDGRTPVSGFSKAKAKLDDLSGISDPPWVYHDLRRTMRSHLSALPVQDVVREAVIAHARRGVAGVYDKFNYADEKRQCLELWEQRLRGILAPPVPASVTDLRVARERWSVSAS
jgi:integrase